MNRKKILESSLLEDIRIKQTPKNNPLRGYWTGKRGNSVFIPTHNQDEIIKILNEYNLCGINYQKGIIDLNPCSIATVSLFKMYIIRYKNFKICDMLCANLWNNSNFLNTASRAIFSNLSSKGFKSLYLKSGFLFCIAFEITKSATSGFLGSNGPCKYVPKILPS